MKENSLQAFRVTTLAVMLQPYTCYLQFNSPKGDYKVGSGTLVEINRKLFLFTAAHVFSNMPSFISISLSSNGSINNFRIVRRDLIEELDIGYIELDFNEIDPFLLKNSHANDLEFSKEPLALDRISYKLAEEEFYISGFTTELSEFKEIYKGSYITEIRPLLYSVDLEKVEDNDLIFSFDLKCTEVVSKEKYDLNNPAGLSGGGIWQFSRDRSNPPMLKGIITHHISAENKISASRVKPLVDLIIKNNQEKD